MRVRSPQHESSRYAPTRHATPHHVYADLDTSDELDPVKRQIA